MFNDFDGAAEFSFSHPGGLYDHGDFLCKERQCLRQTDILACSPLALRCDSSRYELSCPIARPLCLNSCPEITVSVTAFVQIDSVERQLANVSAQERSFAVEMPQMLLVVLGATGAQGGAVLRHFARNCKDFRLRGITRNPTSTKSKELSAIDVEMVKADLNDKASLALAFDEATHIFANIDSVEPIIESMQQSNLLKPGQTPFERGAELEKLQARNLIEASAASPTLERIIWSTLPGVSAKSGAKYTKVTHFDAKAEIAEMFMTHEVLKSKVSFLFVGLYFDMPLRVPELYPIWKVGRLSGPSSMIAI